MSFDMKHPIVVADDAVPGDEKCKNCGSRMTYQQLRKQYARLLGIGLSPENAKPLLPRCQKCVTQLLKEY